LDINWAILAPKLAGMAIPATIASAFAGGAFAHFKVWLIKEEDILDRVNLAKKTLTAKVASAHRRLLTAYENKILGGTQNPADEFADKDVVEFYAAQVLSAAAQGAQFETCEIQNKRHYDCFFWSAVAALILAICAGLFDETRPFVALAGIALIAWQVCLVYCNRTLAQNLRKHEQSLSS
jgi:hypothetical protein